MSCEVPSDIPSMFAWAYKKKASTKAATDKPAPAPIPPKPTEAEEYEYITEEEELIEDEESIEEEEVIEDEETVIEEVVHEELGEAEADTARILAPVLYDDETEEETTPDVEEQVALRLAERRRALDAKLARREERRKALEEKLSSNKAVKLGRELLESHNFLSAEQRERQEAIRKRQAESKKRMDEHKKACAKVIGHMQDRIDLQNAYAEKKAQEYAEREAFYQAEKERLKAEKAAKKIEDKQKWELYEQRRNGRATTKQVRRA
ncbi:expressed unknown protein [Seminavis robusta]|uniref:Uncharacterized protein n=1 Tax=Seminavis robusta TaxID=568900 RepID=A0A9N8HY33_9STRA|nr:expressed unknown protein [Seminavis robusta]|eukprot:Sro1924_g305680.1 n/a (265) ;mRNA; f:3919-4713